MKIKRSYRCQAIVQPGEYMIDRWDGRQCEETNPRLLIRCEACGQSYCSVLHWHKHQDAAHA